MYDLLNLVIYQGFTCNNWLYPNNSLKRQILLSSSFYRLRHRYKWDSTRQYHRTLVPLLLPDAGLLRIYPPICHPQLSMSLTGGLGSASDLPGMPDSHAIFLKFEVSQLLPVFGSHLAHQHTFLHQQHILSDGQPWARRSRGWIANQGYGGPRRSS